jgi:hypothetical protein
MELRPNLSRLEWARTETAEAGGENSREVALHPKGALPCRQYA